MANPKPPSQYYVLTPTTLDAIKPISANNSEEAGRVGVAAQGLTGGVVLVIPLDAVKTYDITISPQVTLTPRG